MKKKEKQYIDMETQGVIIEIPKGTVKLSIKMTVIDEDGTEIKVKKKLKKADIEKARKDFLENVELGDDYDIDGMFEVTEKGKEILRHYNELLQQFNGDSCDD